VKVPDTLTRVPPTVHDEVAFNWMPLRVVP
jgi:hypothetical protein